MLEHFFGHKKTAGPGVGDAAPDFSLATLEGGRFTLSEALQTGPAVIAFFKVSCPTCQFTLPFLDRLNLAYQNDPVQFWAISQDNEKKSRMFREQFGVKLPMALDGEKYPASKSYGFSNVPTIFLIDHEGQIRFRLSGFSKADLIRLSEEIANLIGRAPAPVFLANEMVPEVKPG